MNGSNRVKVVVLCCEGLFQEYLICRLCSNYDVMGVVYHSYPRGTHTLIERLSRYINPIKAFHYIHSRIARYFYNKSAEPLLHKLFYINDHQPELSPDIPHIHVSDVNSPECTDFVRRLSPEIICVNGTNLLRKPMLDLEPGLKFGIINMHTGLSPYSRGGNCNLHMLLEGHPEYVGVTIHHISSGIDSGDIIISACPVIQLTDNFEMIEAKVFHDGIELMVVAVRQLIEGRAERVPQWEHGKLFLERTGYVYDPYLHVLVNHKIKNGLIREYFKHREKIDSKVVLIGSHS